MKYIIGNPSNQAPLIPMSLKEQIGQDNEVRVIDFFVDSPLLSGFGFRVDQGGNGRPAYPPGFKGPSKGLFKAF